MAFWQFVVLVLLQLLIKPIVYFFNRLFCNAFSHRPRTAFKTLDVTPIITRNVASSLLVLKFRQICFSVCKTFIVFFLGIVNIPVTTCYVVTVTTASPVNCRRYAAADRL